VKKLFILISVIISGCVYHIELFKTAAINSKSTQSGYVYENDTLTITYNFWAKGGIMQWTIYNKTNSIIFIDLKLSSFIKNGIAFQYKHSDRNIPIPPRSAILNADFTLIPSHGFNIKAGDYTLDTSPLKFRIFIVYYSEESINHMSFIDNQFYVSHTELILEPNFEHWKGDNKNGSPIYEYPFKDPISFFSERVEQ
jgi:hypothetical protein